VTVQSYALRLLNCWENNYFEISDRTRVGICSLRL
jgi:hypothetical protein